MLCHYTLGRRWLDLGCGRGTNDPALIPIRERAGERIYVGVDADMDSLKDCTETNRVSADAKSLPFPDGSFDVVTSNMVFEHLADPVPVLQEANRVLVEGGVLIVHTASSVHYMLLAGRLLSRILPSKSYLELVSRYTGRKKEDIFPTRYKANTRAKFSRTALKAGFRGGFITYLETPLDFPAGMRFFEERMRSVLPSSLKSTLLAVYIKSKWT